MLPCLQETPVTLTRWRSAPLEPQTLTDAPGGPPESPARFSGSGAPVVSPPDDPQPASSEAVAIAVAREIRAVFIAAPPYPAASSRAREKIASSISSVSLPVKVFCWLG